MTWHFCGKLIQEIDCLPLVFLAEMSIPQGHLKLTAIFSADAAGYSRLMGDDEAASVKTLEFYRQIMFSLINRHRGRVVASSGDNLLAEFASVVDAVHAESPYKRNFRRETLTS